MVIIVLLDGEAIVPTRERGRPFQFHMSLSCSYKCDQRSDEGS